MASLVTDYRTAEYRSFLWVQHEEHGFVLLHCTRKKSKGPHWQTPGGRIDDFEFDAVAAKQGDRHSQLCEAGTLGAARELYEETGIDVRSNLERLIPARLHLENHDDALPNEWRQRLFFVLTVSDHDFSESGAVGAMGTDLVDCQFRHLKLKLSVEHSGFTFQRDLETVAQMLSLHSGGHVSEALRMAVRVDPTQFGS